MTLDSYLLTVDFSCRDPYLKKATHLHYLTTNLICPANRIGTAVVIC